MRMAEFDLEQKHNNDTTLADAQAIALKLIAWTTTIMGVGGLGSAVVFGFLGIDAGVIGSLVTVGIVGVAKVMSASRGKASE
ncbi:hypothetical protein BC102111_01713 [Brevibacterium casei CIP 102111]|uniref:Uncharacterized protein n=2 Tax=Brevibacterium casei TaxID=33889 RepID=A0A2H1IY12_9MICO|nr:hypothetical protein BC102111_01713 [Brevibacterium casei CIP 102111]